MIAISSITAASRKKAMLSPASAIHFSVTWLASQVAKPVAICSCAISTPKPADTAMMAVTMALVRTDRSTMSGSACKLICRSTNRPMMTA